MQTEKRGSERQTEETTTSFLRSKGIYGIYQYRQEEDDDLEKQYRSENIFLTDEERVLAQFIDLGNDVCLECGLVHGNRRMGARGWRKNDIPYLDRLFWWEVHV
jgi:hypothetical protein